MQNRKFQVICDSCCDLPKEDVAALDIGIVPLYVSFDGKDYKRDYYDFTYHDFYQHMADEKDVYPKTSLPGFEDYQRAWEPYLEKGIPVLNISMTSRMSGSYNAAVNAASIMREKYPDIPIKVVDSQALTLYEGMLVREACRMRDQGYELLQAENRLLDIRKDGRAYFTVGDLSYLMKGGRIGSLMRLASVGLGLKPIIIFSGGGISLCTITRSRQKSLSELAKQAAKYFSDIKEDPRDYYLEVGYGLKKDDGEELLELFREELGKRGLSQEARLSQIGTMVGAHNGPYLMGIAMQKKMKL